MGERTCTIEGCEKRHVARGWCDTHYCRWKRTGDPLNTRRIIGDDHARFWSYVDKDGANGCWVWTGAMCGAPRGEGYGNINIGGRLVIAHRYAFEEIEGPIPNGLVLDHLCRNQRCVNPAHLEAVTQWENVHRGRLLKITDERLEELIAMRDAGATLAELGRLEGVKPEAIALRIKKRGDA